MCTGNNPQQGSSSQPTPKADYYAQAQAAAAADASIKKSAGAQTIATTPLGIMQAANLEKKKLLGGTA